MIDGIEGDDSWKTYGQGVFACFSCIGFLATWGPGGKKRAVVVQNGGSSQIPSIPQFFENGEAAEYDQLRTDGDIQQVYDVISPIGKLGVFELWNREDELQEKGKMMRKKIHTFRFLEIIFHHPELRDTVQTIFRSTGPINDKKKGKFLEGVDLGMREWEKKNLLECYSDGFAKKMGLSPLEIKPLILQKNWERLMNCLCQKSALPAEQMTRV